MRKSVFLWVLALFLLLVISVCFLSGCRKEKEVEFPSVETLARFGVSSAFPHVATLGSVYGEEALLRLCFTGADSEDFDTVIAFLQGEQFTQQNGKPSEKTEAVSGRFFAYTAERAVSGETVRVVAAYFVRDGSFDGQTAVGGDLFVRFSVLKPESGTEEPAELPRSTDYTLPVNLRAELSFGGNLMLAVKIGDSYYSERYGAAYFYLPGEDGTYTEYLCKEDTYTPVRTLGSRIAAEYLVFGLLLDAGEYDFQTMTETESVTRFDRRLSVYTETHEGITETVFYDPVSHLIFFYSVSVDGYGEQINEVLCFDETVTDFGSVPLP